METRKNTTVGDLLWTLAPVQTSPTSSVISEDAWEDEDEEEAEKDDDFDSQMNENGIIGLSDALEDLELVACCDSDLERNPNMCSAPVTHDEADPSGCERDTPEELSDDLSKHCSLDSLQGDGGQILSPFVDPMYRAEAQMMDRKKDGGEAGTRRDWKRKKTKHPRHTNVLGESYISKGEIEKTSSLQSFSAPLLAMGPATVSDPHCPISQPVTAPIFHHHLYFTAEETAVGPGIDAETLPEMSFTESPSESHRSHVSLKPSSRYTEVKLRASLQPAAVFSKEGVSNHYSEVNNAPLKASDKSGKPDKQPTPSPRKMRQHSPEAPCSNNRSLSTAKVDSLKFKHRTTSPDNEWKTPRARNNAAEMDESRKGPLSYRTPDFSKVEPKVHFPKDGYIPPKSKHPSNRMFVSSEPPFVFKSPVDIVKEVLLRNTAGSSASSDSYKPPTSGPNSTVPQEFRCRQQATTLLDQLQDDYNKLLTKHAEAENTIDRLRLQAKVNLYSDPPKPGHLVQAGLNRGSSQVMMLGFPQAQRAEFSSASLHPNGHSNHQRSSSAHLSTSQDPQVGQQLANIIYSQADKFHQQLQTFENLLKSKKLRPFDQMEGLSQLAGGLDSLERGYLLAKDEHKVLLQRGAQISHFDSERELEGMIFQCGLCMEELKEQVEQMQQEQPTCVAPPSPPPHPTSSSVLSEGGETLTDPQSPPVPLLVDPGEAAAMEVSSASEESPEEEETLNSLYLKPLNGKQRHVEQDFTAQMDHYQSFKELPKVRANSQREGAPLSAALRSNMQPADGDRERQSHGTEGLEIQKSLPQRKNKSDHLDSPPVKQQANRSSSPSHRASCQSTTLDPLHPLHPLSSGRKLEVRKSHSSSLSSLGEITALEKRSSKLQTGSSGVLSQDGIISPETDSGFVCSESSRMTPAVAPIPLHQRASASVSVPQEGNLGNPQIVSVPSPASSPAHSHVASEPRSDSRLSRDQQRRIQQGQRRRTFSCSPQRQTEQTMAGDGTSESGLESESYEQNDQYTEASRHHRGNSLRPLRSGQILNHNGEFQELQAEVTRLRQRLEICVRKRTPPSTTRAAQENYIPDTSTPRIRSGERWCDVRGRRDTQTVDEVEESTLRETTRKKTPSTHRQKTQPDISTGSESSSPNPQPLVSRCTQTSTAAPDGHRSHTNTVRSRTHSRRRLGVSETADEPDGRRHLSRHQERSEIGGNREPAHSFCCHCYLLCGRPEPSRSTEPDSPTRISCHLCPPDRAASSRHFAAAASPAVLQCMPLCPPPLLMYPSPLYVSPSHSTPSEVRDCWKMRPRTRNFQFSDKQHAMDSSLSRAIKAAKEMKNTSGHMARSLATGVQYQELLTQSCSYQSAHSPHRQHRLSNLRLSTSTGAEGTECRTR